MALTGADATANRASATPAPTAGPTAGVARFGRRITPTSVHYTALIVAAVVYLVVSTRGWFFYDDYAFIVQAAGQNAWAPHVGHWSTVPLTLFLVLRGVFGLNSYVPFAIPVIVAALAFAHVMWRFMLRVGVAAPIASALSVLLIFFGAGSENILWAFQIGFVGAMTLAMLVILILLRPTLRPVDIGLIIVLSLLALASSGTSLPLLIVAALIGWYRHGFLRTVAVLALPAVAYLVWYLLSGRFGAKSGAATGLGQILFAVPPYSISMLTDGLGRAFPIAVLGPLLFAAVAIWGVLSYRDAAPERKPAYILFVAAPLFALFTGISRVNLGIETATSSRYLYFVIPVMLPLMALGLTAIVRRVPLRMGAVLVLLGILIVYNIGGLIGSIDQRDLRANDARERLSAAVALAPEYPKADTATGRPALQWAPDVAMSDLRWFVAQGWFTPGRYDAAAALTERGLFGLEASGAPAPSSTAGCSSLTDGSSTTVRGDEVVIRAASTGSVGVSLESGSATGDPTQLALRAGWNEIDLGGPAVTGAKLVLSSPSESLTVCAG